MKTRLGLDIGTNSIGWALLKIDQENRPIDIVDMGVRVFSDGREPKTQVSLAVERRLKRQQRRRYDRLLQRKQSLLRQLSKMGLWPNDSKLAEDLKSLDVFKARVNALSEKMDPFHLGRLFLHLNQKRGFLSGRKVNPEDAKNKVSERIKHLKEEMEKQHVRSYGEYLFKKIRNGGVTKATVEEGIYPTRDLIVAEFDKIVQVQKSFFPNISKDDWTVLKQIIFHQRPLKAVELGPCSLYPDQARSYRFLPSFEAYRFLSAVFNLSWLDANYKTQSLTADQVFEVFQKCYNVGKLKGAKVKKTLKLDESVVFKNTKDKDIEINGPIESLKFQAVLVDKWDNLSFSQKDDLVLAFYIPETEEDLKESIKGIRMRSDFANFTEEEWSNLASIKVAGDTTVAFSKMALHKILEVTFAEKRSPAAIVYDLRREEKLDGPANEKLEYYGKVLVGRVVSNRHILKDIKGQLKNPAPHVDNEELKYGKIANPTVHVVLRQLEKLVNDIISRFGKPEQIHLEMVRELKMSSEKKALLQKRNTENQKVNEAADALIKDSGLIPSGFYRERYRLWNELQGLKICVYSGRTISQENLFSDEIEVDHILPFSRTLDDGIGNKVLVFRAENRIKGNKSPSEAWLGDSVKYGEILGRAEKLLPKSKFYKFLPDAMAKFADENSFIARQLTDTAYSAKIAKEYLSTVVDKPDANVLATPGRMTSLIRSKLGFSKDRKLNDLHHALDAFIVAITDRRYLKQAAENSTRDVKSDRFKISVSEPWSGFRPRLEAVLSKVVVSRKVDHGIGGRFLEESALGPVSLTKEPGRIESNELLKKSALVDGVRKVSYEKIVGESVDTIGSLSSQVQLIRHGTNKKFLKFYRKSEVHHAAIWSLKESEFKAYKLRKGEKVRKNSGISYVTVCPYLFDVYVSGRDYDRVFKPHPAAKLVMKLHKGDLVSIEIDGRRSFRIIKSISPANDRFSLVCANGEEGIKNYSFNVFMAANPRKHFISPSGKVL